MNRPQDINLLLVRERNIDGCGDFADVLVLLDKPATPQELAALQETCNQIRQSTDCPDTDTVVQEALRHIFGGGACWAGYQFIAF